MNQFLNVQMIPIHQIGADDRFRKDDGDLSGLSDSMGELGMLQPIGVTSDWKLVFGGRRLSAAKLLGWPDVPAVVLHTLTDAVALLKAERDENVCQKPMTPSELVSLGKAIESVAKEEAAKRQAATQIREGVLPVVEPVPPPENKGKTRDIVGKAIGVSGKTFEQMKKVVDRGTPELVSAMDDGELPIKVAAQVAELPPDTQREIVFSQDPRETAKEAVEEFCCDESYEEATPEVESEQPRRKLPKHFVPGGKAVDPQHPFASILNAMTALSASLTKAMASEQGDKLKDYLTAVQVGKFPAPQLVEHRALWVEGKTFGARFVGLRGLRRIVKLAGLPGKPKPADKLREEFTAEGDE